MTKMLVPGDLVPWFAAEALGSNPRFVFDTTAGVPTVLLVLGSGTWSPCAAALEVLAANRDLFDDKSARFFGISFDPSDADGRIAPQIPGVRWFMDRDRSITRLLGGFREQNGKSMASPHWLLLDRSLRVVSRAPIEKGARIMSELRAFISKGEELPNAPVLVLPRVFDPATCRRLISLYEEHGGGDSGFMQEQGGVTVGVTDHSFKRRSDHMIEEEEIRAALRARIDRFLVPQVQRAFQFEATRIERWLVACYDADAGGHFRPHRDNTTKGTAHRKFACTINLNADDYEGGDLRFPEYGSRTYRAPTGGAVIFSCSVLHEAMPVTRGKRYAFLPFLYDEAGARIREQNTAFVTGSLAAYRAERPADPPVSVAE